MAVCSIASISPLNRASFGGVLLVSLHEERRRPEDDDGRGGRNGVFRRLAVLGTGRGCGMSGNALRFLRKLAAVCSGPEQKAPL
jgi:hypothetical protein